MYLFIYLCIYLFMCLCIYLFIWLIDWLINLCNYENVRWLYWTLNKTEDTEVHISEYNLLFLDKNGQKYHVSRYTYTTIYSLGLLIHVFALLCIYFLKYVFLKHLKISKEHASQSMLHFQTWDSVAHASASEGRDRFNSIQFNSSVFV